MLEVVLTLVMHCSVPSPSNPHTKFASCLVQLCVCVCVCVCVRVCGGGYVWVRERRVIVKGEKVTLSHVLE